MKKIRYWIPVFLIMTIIFWLSGRQKISVSSQTIVNFVIFKSLHMIEYGLLLIANYRAIYNSFGKNRMNAGIYAFLITIIYAMTDEIHQLFVPTREGRVRDVGFDTIGAGITLYCIWNILPKMPKPLFNLAKKLEIF